MKKTQPMLQQQINKTANALSKCLQTKSAATAWYSSHFTYIVVRIECLCVCGQVVRALILTHFGHHHCGFKQCKGLWIPSCEETIQLDCGTLVGLLCCMKCTEEILKSSSTSCQCDLTPPPFPIFFGGGGQESFNVNRPSFQLTV